jgi:hypothetical protein
MESIPEYSVTFCVAGLWEGKWQRKFELLAAASDRLNLGYLCDDSVAWVQEFELNVCVYAGDRRILNRE